MKVLEQLMTKTMTNTYVVIFSVGFTFRSLLSFQIYIYIEFTDYTRPNDARSQVRCGHDVNNSCKLIVDWLI